MTSKMMKQGSGDYPSRRVGRSVTQEAGWLRRCKGGYVHDPLGCRHPAARTVRSCGVLPDC